MTSQRLTEFWKLAGKLVKLADLGAADGSGLKVHLVNTLSQFGLQTGGVELYDDMMTVIVPLETRVQGVAGSLDRVSSLVKASMESYLRAVAPELSQPATASPVTLLGAIATRMSAVGGSIAPSGNRFWTYFRDGWGFTGFPTNASPTYPDSYVTTSIV